VFPASVNAGAGNAANPTTVNPPSGASLPTERYSYDLVHNRLTENRSGGEALTATNSNASTATATPSLTDITAAYSYNANHQITEIRNSALPNTAAASLIQSFSYNADGHTTTIATNAQIPNNIQLPERPETRSFLYDAQERLIQINDGGNIIAMYRYDPFGRRILKTLTQAGADNANTAQAKLLASGANTPNVNPGSTYYGYNDEGLVAEYASAGSGLSNGDMLAAYGYLPNQTWQTNPAYKRDTPLNVSLSNPSNTSTADRIHLFHNDHLGSPQRLTDIEGKTSWAASFESFGRGYADASAGATPAITSASPTVNNHRFPGQLLDAETGLHQNLMRDYSPMMGRYAQSDLLGLGGGVNALTYALSAPLRTSDPEGLCTSYMNTWTQPGGFEHGNWSEVWRFQIILPGNSANVHCEPEPEFESHGVKLKLSCKLCLKPVGYWKHIFKKLQRDVNKLTEHWSQNCEYCSCNDKASCGPPLKNWTSRELAWTETRLERTHEFISINGFETCLDIPDPYDPKSPLPPIPGSCRWIRLPGAPPALICTP
jgi:RHS repeat-associated protein